MTDTPANVTTNPMIEFLERIIRSDLEVAKIREILDIQTQVRQEHARQSFNAGMAMVQEEIGTIIRSGTNPTFTSPYAKLEDLDRAARPIYTRHGFSVRYGTAKPPRDGWIMMTLTISHRDGFSETHELPGPIDTQTGARARTAIQAVGSTTTYLRRYLLQMVLNLVPAGDPDDDDGEALRPISVDQVKTIADLIKDTDTDEAVFLAAMFHGFGYKSIEQIAVGQYERAHRALLKKQALKKGTQNNG